MRVLIISLWAVWDWIYFHCNRMQYVSKPDNLFRVVRKKHKGPPLMTSDGVIILPGDEIIKIHLHNYRIASEMKNFSSEIAYIHHFKRSLERSLQGLNSYIKTLPDHQRIKGIVGTSMLNRGAERLGFTLNEVTPSWKNWLKGLLYKLIYLLIHPQGWAYLKRHGKRLKSKHLVMSMGMLNSRYSD